MIRFGLLGPLEVLADDRTVDVGGRHSRVMLAALLVAGGRSVTVESLVDAMWNDSPPASAVGTLHSYLSRLRQRLGPEAPIVRDHAGYRIEIPPEQVDFRRFEALADEGRRRLDEGDAAAARDMLATADALWRGPAFAEFVDLAFAAGPAARLEELRLAAIEDRIEAELALGHHDAVVGELGDLVAAHPRRERLRGQLVRALDRSGRHEQAVRALASARVVLREQFGLDPGPELQALEAALAVPEPSGRPPRPAPPTRSVPPPPSPPSTGTLIGREAELVVLVSALDESADDCRFVVIEGEPGIGKTRLADELRTLALGRGALAVWGRADEGGAAPALWPWLVPLRTLAAWIGETPPAAIDLLGTDGPSPVGPAVMLQFERFEAVADLLGRAAAGHGAVVLLDDLQWADQASLELLAFLGRRPVPGLLVVVTVRDLEVGRNDALTEALATLARRPGTRRLALRGLKPEATAEIAAAARGSALTAAAAAEIAARAEGNPFCAIELSRLVDDDGTLDQAVPGGVGDVIRRRLAVQPPAVTDLLNLAAVLGRDVPLALLARAAGRPLDEVLEAIEPAVVHRLLVEVPEHPLVLRFSHTLVRQVLLEDLTALRRARLHLRVADAIEAGGAGVDDAEVLAQHLWQAAPIGVGARAAAALERAAEVALRRVAYVTAEGLLAKAVQLRRAAVSTDRDDEAELTAMLRLLEVARALRYYQGIDAIDVDRAKELAERCGRRDLLVAVSWAEWSALSTSVRRPQSEVAARAYVRLTEGDPDPAVRASGDQVLGVEYWQAGRLAEACAGLDRAQALLAQAPRPASPFLARQAAITDLFRTMTHLLRGDLPPADGFARFDRLVAATPDRFAVASICGFAATAALALGRWADAGRYVEAVAATDPRSQFGFLGGQDLMHHAIVQAWHGEVEQALRRFEEGRTRYESLGGRSALALYQSTLAIHVAHHGRVDAARRLAAAARAELDARREEWTAPWVLLAEAAVAEADGDGSAAQTLRSRAAAVADEQGAHALADWARAGSGAGSGGGSGTGSGGGPR